MPRFDRDQVLLTKIESSYNTDSSPAAATNAVLVSKPRITPISANNVDRDLVRAWFGASEQLPGTRFVQCDYEVELAGSGTAGTPPAFGHSLRACALAETIIAATRVDYTPITNNQESVTKHWYDSGVLHKLLGARGNAKLSMLSGGRPGIAFSFWGLYSTPTTATPSGVDYSAFLTPQVVTDANSGDIVIGGTVSPTGAPAISGGTIYPSLGLDFDLGNNVQHVPLLGGESVDVTARASTGSMKLDATAAQEVAFYADVLAATLRAVSMQHGTAVGNKVLFHQPSVQLMEPSKEEFNGRRLLGLRTRAVPAPGGSGNNECRLVFF